MSICDISLENMSLTHNVVMTVCVKDVVYIPLHCLICLGAGKFASSSVRQGRRVRAPLQMS